jgi:hypothetical protein
MWEEKWPVIDPKAGLHELEEAHRIRRETMLENHRRELALLEVFSLTNKPEILVQ